VSNSFWFITGTFLRQGSGINPKVDSQLCVNFLCRCKWRYLRRRAMQVAYKNFLSLSSASSITYPKLSLDCVIISNLRWADSSAPCDRLRNVDQSAHRACICAFKQSQSRQLTRQPIAHASAHSSRT
jgi:hypothetical protein